MTKELIMIVGGGGHSHSVASVLTRLEQYELVAFVDQGENVGKMIGGYPVIDEQTMAGHFEAGIHQIIIAIGDNKKRMSLYEKYKKMGYVFPNIVGKHACVAVGVRLGEGNFIGEGVMINNHTQIGHNCILNTGCIIEHDCLIEDGVHIAPGAILCGQVHVEAYTLIGAGAIISPNQHVGRETVVGDGSNVVHSISANKVAYGNPCREVRDNVKSTDYS